MDDKTFLENWDVELRYLTLDARRVLKELGINGGMTIHWQVLLMEYCHNYNPAMIVKDLKQIRDQWVGITPNTTINRLGNRSINLGKKHGSVTFNAKGVKNLYLLDRSITAADYSMRLEELAGVLNDISRSTLMAWMDTIEGKLSMPIAFYRLQEYISENNEERKEVRKMMDFVVPTHEAMDEESRNVLRGVLEEIRDLKRATERTGDK